MDERARAWAAAVVVLMVVCAAAGMIGSLLAPDFSADINRVFVAGPPLDSVTKGMNFIEDGGYYDSSAYHFAAGIRLALLGLFWVGIPLGISAKVLSTGNRWSSFDQQWGSVFQTAFLFQLGSLVIAVAALLLMSFDGLQRYKNAPLFSLMLIGDVAIGVIALPSWRALQEGRRSVALHH
jgi:hypothetical protein